MSPKNLLVLHFTRVLFGIVSSPFLLGAIVLHHLSNVGTENAQKALEYFYVDNLVIGTATDLEAIKFYDEIRRSYKEMSMNIKEWGSNSEIFVQHLPNEYRICNKSIRNSVGHEE